MPLLHFEEPQVPPRRRQHHLHRPVLDAPPLEREGLILSKEWEEIQQSLLAFMK